MSEIPPIKHPPNFRMFFLNNQDHVIWIGIIITSLAPFFLNDVIPHLNLCVRARERTRPNVKAEMDRDPSKVEMRFKFPLSPEDASLGSNVTKANLDGNKDNNNSRALDHTYLIRVQSLCLVRVFHLRI